MNQPNQIKLDELRKAKERLELYLKNSNPNAGSSNALSIVHNEGCIQGYIYDALSLVKEQGLIDS